MVLAVLWLAALPEFLDAEDGITDDGTPIGSGLYAISCFVGAVGVLAVLYSSRRRTSVLSA